MNKIMAKYGGERERLPLKYRQYLYVVSVAVVALLAAYGIIADEYTEVILGLITAVLAVNSGVAIAHPTAQVRADTVRETLTTVYDKPTDRNGDADGVESK